jgi:hypothetical protein
MNLDLLKLVLNLFEITACAAGFYYWKKIRHTHWKYFPFYLAAIVLFELTGKYLTYIRQNHLKVNMYNYLVIPLQVFFFIWLFYRELAHTRFKKLPLAAAGIYGVCWVADVWVLKKKTLWWLSSFSYSLGVLLLLVMILAFLYLLANSSEVLFLKTNMMFWVCLGLVVFYFCTLPFFGIGNYLYYNHPKIYIGYARAVYFLNYGMYGIFTIAFIWGKPKLSFLQG